MNGETPAFIIEYRNRTIEFFRLDGQGYAYRCPRGCCRAWHWIDTETGKRHRITSKPGDPVTIVASLGCPCASCTFHVVVTDGVARDA